MIEISDDKTKLDIEAIHRFLKTAYWCEEIPKAILEKAIEHSLCFGVYDDGKQIGFSRVVTDRSTYAYLADVFILPEYRGQGLSKRMMEKVMNHPELQGLRRWSLATRDAHGLYKQFGFTALARPDRMMEIVTPDIYKKTNKKTGKRYDLQNLAWLGLA